MGDRAGQDGMSSRILTRALERMVQVCGGQKKYRDVKESSQHALSLLQGGRGTQASATTTMLVCFIPLRFAAESKNAKLIEISLGCLQKLMEYSFITGDMRWTAPKLEGVDTRWAQAVQGWATPQSPSGPAANGAQKGDHEQQFIHQVVSCICANTSFNDDGVQLQIIKALLTAVSTKACGVHGTTLVMAVRNTFNSYVQSRNQTNQNTAYAALSHMINIVFRNMEDAGLPETPAKDASAAPADPNADPSSASTPRSHVSATASEVGGGSDPVEAEVSVDAVTPPPAAARPRAGAKEEAGEGEGEGGEQIHPHAEGADAPEEGEGRVYDFVRREVVGVVLSRAVGAGEGEEEADQGEEPEAPPPAPVAAEEGGADTAAEEPRGEEVEEVAPGAGVSADAGESDEKFDFDTALAERLAARAGDIVAAGGGGAAPKKSSSSAPSRRVSTVGQERLDGVDMVTGMEADAMVFHNQQQKDAYLLFYAFTVLSEKQIPENVPEDSLEMKSKMLSLELLYSILHGAGPVFLSSERFIKTVKKKLCLSLIQHCVSPLLPIFKMSLQLFLSLISKFKDNLKREVGFFFTNVFFQILESANSSYQQKIMVLQVLHKVCETPQTIIDIFVNYDCDMQSVNIFEIMVNHLSRLLQGRGVQGAGLEATKLDQDMRMIALRCLVMIVRSICLWTERFSEAEAAVAEEDQPVTGGSMLDTPVAGRTQSGTLETEENADEATTPAGRQQDTQDEVQRAKAHKKEMQDMIAVFNKSSKKGVQMLWDSGSLEKDTKSVARFFREQAGLSKDGIGEYLSVHKEFNQKVLSDFVETFDFGGLQIDEAVRKFMSSFRIHGEAETIDMTMEKFAETYTKANQATFPNASTAYVLSFSIIMLHTDAHSVSIKTKMTKDEFMKNNRGIDDGKNIADSLLSDIYDRITSVPFTLEGEERRPNEAARKKTGAFERIGVFDRVSNDGKRRQLNYAEESKEMLKKTKALLKTDGKEGAYIRASKMEHVRPMFEAAWAAMLPAFSVILERCQNDQQVQIDLCLEGFVRSIHIACLFFLDVERDAFVSALSKLTFLNNLREIEPKNIKSIKALIDTAGKEGGYLRSSWFAILRCFSQLERLQLLGAGAKPDFAFLNEPIPAGGGRKHSGQAKSHHFNSSLDGTHSSAGSQAGNGSVSGGKSSEHERERLRLEERNSQIIADQIDEVAVARVYSNTIDLSGEAIVFFVRHLCEVSTEEIEQSHPPRMFSLQKLIEIADVNMGRIRFVWGQLWQYMSKHFIRVGTNKSLFVSMFGIDSLRQLSIKFLEKRELSNYNFQRDFLKPFETIFQESYSIEVRELIVRCMKQIVDGKAQSVKSGWKSIFAVLALAATDSNDQIVTLAFEVANTSVSRLFPMVVAADAFVDVVNCLISFSCNTQSSDIAIKSIAHLQRCANSLAEGIPANEDDTSGAASPTSDDVTFVLPPLKEGDKIDSEDRLQMRLWFPVFTGLGTGATQHPDVNVRLASINALFDIMKSHGGRFTLGMWKIVMSGTVYPIFDNAVCDLCETSTLSTYSPSSSASIMMASTAPERIPAGTPTGEPSQVPSGKEPADSGAESQVPKAVSRPNTLSPDEAIKNMNVIEVGLAFLVDLFARYYHDLKHLLGEVLNIILICCKRPTPLKVANYGVTALVELVGNHCAVESGVLSHGYHQKDMQEASRKRGLAREKNLPDDAFTEEEWKMLATKLTQSFEAKMLGNKSACLLEIKSAYTTTAKGLERVAPAAPSVNKNEMTLPYQAAMSHLTALSNLLVTQSLLVQHLSQFWSEPTLTIMLGCFGMIHGNVDLLVGGVSLQDVTRLASLCEERALLLHVRTILSLFAPHEEERMRVAGLEGFDPSNYPHSDAVRPAVYQLLQAVLETKASSRRFDLIVSTAVQALCTLTPQEFADVHARFYPALLELVVCPSPTLRLATKAFFTRVGRLQLGIENLVDVPFPIKAAQQAGKGDSSAAEPSS